MFCGQDAKAAREKERRRFSKEALQLKDNVIKRAEERYYCSKNIKAIEQFQNYMKKK